MNHHTTTIAAFFAVFATGVCAAADPDIASVSPLRVDQERMRDGSLAAVPLQFDAAAYEQLRGKRDVVLDAFPLAPLNRGQAMQSIELELTRMSTITDRSQFVVASYIDGKVVEEPMEQPDVQIFRGRVAGDDSSYAFISFSPHGTHGYIRTQGVTQLISPGPFGQDHTPLIYNLNAMPDGAILWRDFICQAQTQGGEPWPAQAIGGDAASGVAPCRRAEIAIESDREFTMDLFGGNIVASGAYAATLMSASSEIFERDINVQFEIVYVRLWQFEDPWTQNSTSAQLFQFRDYWNANMGNIPRHLAHFLSGRALGGGVAWLNAVCHNTQGYALSANLNGSFPYPLQDNSSQNWDIMVVTHEFGHNFGSPHTHDYCPPIDECYTGQCSSGDVCINNGTIMGYCHLCPGGMTNVTLEFGPVVSQRMLDYLDTVTSCYLGCVPHSSVVYVPLDTPSIQEAITAVLPGGEVIVSPGTYNESINTNGKAVRIHSTDGPQTTIIDASGLNGTVARFSSGEGAQTVLEGFTLTGGTGASISIGGTNYVVGGGIYTANSSSPIIRNCIIIGNAGQFGGGMFNNSASPTVEDCIFTENAAVPSSGGGVFNFSGSAPQFTNTQFIANTSVTHGGGMSNQTSSPVLTNCLFIDNTANSDGGAVRNISNSAAQFIGCTFQNNTAAGTGGAFINDTSAGTTITASIFCENAPNDITGGYTNGGDNSFIEFCAIVGDLNGDGVVDVSDMLMLLGAWGDCPGGTGCVGDLDGDGAVDVGDLLILLGNWG